jgi:hypothetical protein
MRLSRPLSAFVTESDSAVAISAAVSRRKYTAIKIANIAKTITIFHRRSTSNAVVAIANATSAPRDWASTSIIIERMSDTTEVTRSRAGQSLTRNERLARGSGIKIINAPASTLGLTLSDTSNRKLAYTVPGMIRNLPSCQSTMNGPARAITLSPPQSAMVINRKRAIRFRSFAQLTIA